MSEGIGRYGSYKYKVGDKFDFDGEIEIVGLKDYLSQYGLPVYEVATSDGGIKAVDESWIDSGVEHYAQKEEAKYGVSYIASAPEEFKVGDKVEILVGPKDLNLQGEVTCICEDGSVNVVCESNNGWTANYRPAELRKLPDPIHFDKPALEEKFPVGIKVKVVDADAFRAEFIGKVGVVVKNPEPDKGNSRVLFDKVANIELKNEWLKVVEEEKPTTEISTFRRIVNEMADTYERKNADYGNAYEDGFRRFGAVQLVSRIYEKYCRIENLLCRKTENKVKDESVADTLTDIAVQTIILRMLLKDNDFENVE